MGTELSLYSSLFLTVLIAIGLFFFIRASVKDRTQQATFTSEVAPELLREQFDHYFAQRAYQPMASGSVVTYQGIVKPSGFLMVFLTVLALAGLGSVALVLTVLVPQGGAWWFLLLSLSPMAGVFYRKRAMRPEVVKLQLVPGPQTTKIHVKAHRDELEKFKEKLGFDS